ncbi:solute carrier family 43 member 3-like isoform X2 [Mizuhopecten yessoensis]|uniref:solute carrier family 43 member 3-like isoform X2 n=1 Tax=Mizuhopecten yessoensis TaxID=6573 RepID=UPI000B4585FC|nr:solute carrier family 43 member 3-like isoform X2 [Mizuhopecten yessoensis]
MCFCNTQQRTFINMDTCSLRVVSLVGFSLLEVLFFGGIQYGWFALVFILKQEGVFENLCVLEDNVSKSNVSSSNVTSDSDGCFLQDERFNLIFSVGVGIFTVATFLAGQLYLSFDTKLIRAIHMAMAVAGILCFAFTSPGICTLLHPTTQKRDVTDGNQTTKRNEENDEPEENEKAKEKVIEDIVNKRELTSGDGDRTSGDMMNMTIGVILCHHLFISHVMWLSVVLLKFYYFLGSANRFMEHILQDESKVSYFTDVMSFVMLGGLVSSFIAGYTMDAMGKVFKGIMRTVIPLAVTSCLTILLSALAFISTPTALYVDFVVLTFLRSFVYSIHVQYIRIAFPMKYISMVYGMAVSISGILTMIQYGLFAWTEEYVGAMTHLQTK